MADITVKFLGSIVEKFKDMTGYHARVVSVADLGTITPGTAATSLGKAEDAAHTSGDVGVLALAVRSDTATATAAAGDYVSLITDANGRLYVAGPVTVASGGIASGAVASGAIASGAIASGAVASGAIASGAIASGAVAAGAVVSGAILSGALATGAIVDLPAKGAAAMAASVPVTVATDQPAIPTKGSDFSVQVDLTVDAGAYSIGDAAGAMMTFAGVVSANGKRGIINSITIAPNDAMPAIPFNLWCLKADLATPIAKNAAWVYVAADGPNILGAIPIAANDYIPSQDAWNVATLRGVGLEFTVPATSLYAYLVCTAVTAPVATHLYITIAGEMRD